MDTSYDFYFRHNMHAVEWKLNALISKNKILIKRINRKCRHPLIINIEHVPISNE